MGARKDPDRYAPYTLVGVRGGRGITRGSGGGALFVLLFLTLGAAPLAAQFDGPEAEVVRQREIAFAQSMADRDFAAFLSFIDEDAIFFGGRGPLRGRAEIGAGWRRLFEGAQAPIAWAPDQVQVLGDGTLALSTGPVTRADGSIDGRFNSVWRKSEDGVWRVVFDKGS